jgi:hypothetical protein
VVGASRLETLLVPVRHAGRAQALVRAPAAFRRRGVFVADYEIDAA